MKHFYVNDTSKIEEYGFTKEKWYFTFGKSGTYIHRDTGRLKAPIPSEPLFAIYRMIKDGLIEVVEEDAHDVYGLKLTGEELKMIREYRKHKKENKQ